MARPSKLTQEQCERIRMLKEEGESAPKLAKRFKISESSLYKILNGSYTAAPSDERTLPPVAPAEDYGATPSMFGGGNQKDSPVTSRVIKAADASQQPIDEVTLAAAELIVAQARYMQLRRHSR